MQCVRSFITRKLLNIEIGRSSGLLHPRCLPIRIDSGLEIRGHFGAYSSGVCSGFSPDSLFTHRPENRGMSTKFSGKYTEDFLICKQNCDIYRKSSFIHPIPPPILSLHLHFIQRRTNLLINSIYWVVVLTTPDAISYSGNV